MKTLILFALLLAVKAWSYDIAITYDEQYGTVSTAHKARIEKIRAFLDSYVLSNGMPATGPLWADSVCWVRIHPAAIDGPSNILAQSGGGGWMWNGSKYVANGWFTIQLDTADYPAWNDQVMGEIILHEIGHRLGWFSNIWSYNGCLDAQGRYVGAAGLAAYRAEYDPLATFVPMEDSHLPEWVNPWAAMTPIHTGGFWMDKLFWAVMQDNGWSVRAFPPDELADILYHQRRFVDEDL